MSAALYVLIYACGLVFVIGCIARALSYARMPLHLRWELYPVPHEEPERARHGGSYFESPEWWAQPFRFNLLGELKVMLPEMLFLKALWEFNRPLWFRSFPFHFGLYLLIATGVLLGLTGALAVLAPEVLSDSLLLALHYLYTATGLAGTLLALFGATGLLIRRLRDATLRIYNAPGDLFNLVWFILTLALLGAGYLLRGPADPEVLELARGLLSFDTSLTPSPLQAAGLASAALLTAYIPWTHMSHFIAKYFTYHSIRWDDLPAAKARELETKIAQYLTYRPTWSAPHVMADGSRTWADIAMSNPAQQEVKK